MKRTVVSREMAYQRSENALVGSSLLALLFLMIGLAIASPAKAAERPTDAEKINQVDVMLLVTSLRCRFGNDDFRAEYDELRTTHEAEFGDASRQIKAEFLKSDPRDAAQRSFDAFVTRVANTYGNGHPWLGCAELKSVTGTLAKMQGREPLIEAYGQLVDQGPTQLAIASASR